MPELTWLGKAAFRIRGKDAIIITDPYSKSAGLGSLSTGGDIVTVSSSIEGHSSLVSVKGHPYVVSGPGEYEVKAVHIHGVWCGAPGPVRNTAYNIYVDGLHICHLGTLDRPLEPQELDALGDVDILLVPLGTYSKPSLTGELVAQMEPAFVVPMGYDISSDVLDRFIKERALQEPVPLERFTVKAGDSEDITQTILLEPRPR